MPVESEIDFDPETQVSAEEQVRLKQTKDLEDAKYLIGERKRAYYHMFVEGEVTAADRSIVLADLERFCRLDTSTFHENERIHTLLTGRQEVALRIRDHMRLDTDALFAKYTEPPSKG